MPYGNLELYGDRFNKPGIRRFKSIEEVRENLDTLTITEIEAAHYDLGVKFDFVEGKCVGVVPKEEANKFPKVISGRD